MKKKKNVMKYNYLISITNFSIKKHNFIIWIMIFTSKNWGSYDIVFIYVTLFSILFFVVSPNEFNSITYIKRYVVVFDINIIQTQTVKIIIGS